MHSRLKFIVPLSLLFCFGCIDVPPVEPPTTSPDGGVDPGEKEEGFTLAVAPVRASVIQGRSQSLQLTLTREGGFSGSVTVSAVNAPEGVTVLPVTIPAGSTSASLEVSVGEGVEPGIQVVALRGTTGTLSHEVTFELTVVKRGDLLVAWASPSEDRVLVKGALPLQVAVEGGAADYVEVLEGQTVLARLEAAPYRYTWDTRAEVDGEYSLTARAVRGATSFVSAEKTVTVDNTAPAVVTRSPGPGAANVSVHDAIQVSFSELMKTSTVKKTSVLVSAEGTSIEVGFSWSADGKTLTLTPAEPLPVASTLSVTLGTEAEPLTDMAGNELPVRTSWTFKVPAWLPMGGAISALPGNTSADNVAMKLGADGSPVIAWSEFNGTEKNIHVSRWNGTAWEALGGALSAAVGVTDANNPSLTLDVSNQITVMWDEGEDAHSTNVYGRKWTGGTWGVLPDMPPSSQELYYDRLSSPSVVRDGNGKLVVAMTAFVGGLGFQIQVVSLNAALERWDVSSPRANDVGQAFGAVLDVDAFGRVIAAHYGMDTSDSGGDWGSFALRMDAGGNWSRFGAPIPASNAMGQVALATDGAGNPLVAWVDAGHSSEDPLLEAAWWQDGAWKRLGHVPGNLSTGNSKPSVLVGNDGKPLVAWSGYASPERSIWVSRWEGNEWRLVGAPLSARSGVSTAAFSPVLALDKNGYPLVAWHESDGSVSDIYVYRYNY